jgi:putative transposase
MTGPTHRKRIKHFHDPGDLHELTFSCYRRMPLLTNDLWRSELSKFIDGANQNLNFELVAMVYMPEHVHLLVFPLDRKPDIGRYLSLVKNPFSHFVRDHLVSSQSPLLQKLTIRERPGKYSFRFWQEGPGFDRNLYSPQAMEASIDYIHRNPVERKLCRTPVDWKWSSARYYLSIPHQQQQEQLPWIHGVRREMFERDHRR